MPVVALALIEYEDGATKIDAVLVDWEEGFTLLGDLGNARGVCLAEELEEAKACHAEGKLVYYLPEQLAGLHQVDTDEVPVTTVLTVSEQPTIVCAECGGANV